MLGNPLTYLGHTLTWGRVRQLESFDDNTFEYDAWGRRSKKNSIWYDYQNGKLYREGRPNGDRITYFYDASGVCGFNYRYNWREYDESGNTFDEANYFYRKNLQGDITAIYSSTGTKVAEYLYDAWGKCTIVTDIDGIATLNPIRYRGYYYDTETGLYYLNSRYYDPRTGRFINADDTKILIEEDKDVLILNLYAYCVNNPIILIDPSGEFPQYDRSSLEGMTGSYYDLRKLTAGNPMYEVHHILERRFYQVPGVKKVYVNNPYKAPSVILKKENHRAATQVYRREFPYGSKYKEMTIKAVIDKLSSALGDGYDWLYLLEDYIN